MKFHRYLNPERPMSIDAARVHGLDDAFLRDKAALCRDCRRAVSSSSVTPG
jgi:DNA polymerase III epsilon subunit-like protein